MNKKQLIELKKILAGEKSDKSCYITLYNGNSIREDVLDLINFESEIKKRCKEKEFVDEIENFFENLIYHLDYSHVDVDAIKLSLQIYLYYKKGDIEIYDNTYSKEGKLKNNAIPLKDYANLFFDECSVFRDNLEYSPFAMHELSEIGLDYNSIFDLATYFQYDAISINVSLSKLKKELSSRGFDTSNFMSLQEIDTKIKNGEGSTIEVPLVFEKVKKRTK